MEPCVLVLGVKTEDIYNVLSGSAAENRYWVVYTVGLKPS